MSKVGIVVFEHRCKICNISRSHPELYTDLHSQILEAGASNARAMNHINARIENEQIPLPKLNNQNMSAHFNSHIAIPNRVNQELARFGGNTGTSSLVSVNPEVGHEIEDMVRRKVGNEVNDYLNLESLRASLGEKLEFLDEVVMKEVDGKKLVDLEAMSQYTVLVREIRSCITDLNKIRQGKQLMNMVIKALIEKQTFQVVRELSREYDQIKKDLLEAGVDNTIVVRMDQGMRLKLAEIVATTARQALEDVTRSYKLQ